MPTSLISNADVFELLNANSKKLPSSMQEEIESFFDASGAVQRFWRATDREPQHVLQEAAARMFRHIDRRDIKIVIYCSASKYFAEPAHASIFCGINNVAPEYAFDISDGCMGWLTSLNIIEKFCLNKQEGYALIISHEFPMGRNGAVYPKCFNISSHTQLKYKLPALTLGEACTLTLVKMDAPSTQCIRVELPSGAELCTVPYRNYNNFLWNSSFIFDEEEFHAHYNEMSKVAALKSISILNKSLKGKRINLVPHSYTRSFEKLSDLLSFHPKIVNYFGEYGNTATSSIPLNIEIARRRGALDHSRPTYAWCASAGIKVCIAELKLNLSIN
ncbi:hypothetical protein [Azospirillum sp. Sh1]|uniref:hypothetical protein n=1 Tax=Azospirillum sp. Sh1 TaxID=2607285 RepID=UPI00165DD7E3|nr:hypothetical protein [Azospirillum sp. Sh1]